MLAEAVVGQRIVDPRPQFGVPLEDLADARRVDVAHCRLERLGRTQRQGLNVRLQIGPPGKSVFLGKGALRVGQPSACCYYAEGLWPAS